jgi:hypothetical protein
MPSKVSTDVSSMLDSIAQTSTFRTSIPCIKRGHRYRVVLYETALSHLPAMCSRCGHVIYVPVNKCEDAV